MANGNVVGVNWKALAVILALVVQTTLVGVWKGGMDARVQNLERSVDRLTSLVEKGMEDRYRGADADRDWNRHMESFHGGE